MWPRVVAFVLLGYLSMGREFAYVGLPSLQIFIGEVVLAAFIVLRPSAVLGRWFRSLVKDTGLTEVAWAIYIFLAYGVFEVLRGLSLGYPALQALQNLVFNYYPLYIFLGVWIGVQDATFLPRLVRWLAWWNGLYGVAYIVFLRKIDFVAPGGIFTLFGQPGGSAVAILGLLAFEPRWRRVWPALLLNAFVLLGTEVRAEWLGVLVGLAAWAVVAQRFGRVLNILGSGAALLAVAYFIDFRVPGARGGELSTRGVIGRALAPVNQELAGRYMDDADSAAGTASWRTEWWREIWASVHVDHVTALIGHAYGFPLTTLVPYLEGYTDIRTPHNVLYYALGYGGWFGVGAFFLLQIALLRLLWKAYWLTGQPFGVVYWATALTVSCFSNFFETPFGAIPFYLLTGLSIAPAVAAERNRWPRVHAPVLRPGRARARRPGRLAVAPAGKAATQRSVRRQI